MAVIEAICDRVAIIDHSHIAEVGKVSEIFSGPKSDIGRQLILGDVTAQRTSFGTSRQIRIIFDGRESSEPVIANMVLACKVPVNIMHADTRDIEGKAMGQMIIQLPEDDTDAGRICKMCIRDRFEFEGIPTFAPEHFARVRQVDTMKRKQFIKGVNQIAQEGAIQIFQEFNSGMEEILSLIHISRGRWPLW